MSKKHLHNVNNARKALAYGRIHGIGVFKGSPRRYFNTCPKCGAHLDPGEACDCTQTEKAAFGDSNTESGKVEKL